MKEGDKVNMSKVGDKEKEDDDGDGDHDEDRKVEGVMQKTCRTLSAGTSHREDGNVVEMKESWFKSISNMIIYVIYRIPI